MKESSAGREPLASVLAEELPITRLLGIQVRDVTKDRIVLGLPLAANRNHKRTVFAGSLNAVATLAGWGALWQGLYEAGVTAHVVIQDGTTRYLMPAGTDVTAVCDRPSTAAMDHALAMLRRRGRTRMTLDVVVHDTAGTVVATLHARYVLHRREG